MVKTVLWDSDRVIGVIFEECRRIKGHDLLQGKNKEFTSLDQYLALT
jgi:hypothetical protein